MDIESKRKNVMLGLSTYSNSRAAVLSYVAIFENFWKSMHAEEYHRPDYNEMLSTAYSLMSKYNVDKVYIDGANPSFIRSLNQ